MRKPSRDFYLYLKPETFPSWASWAKNVDIISPTARILKNAEKGKDTLIPYNGRMATKVNGVSRIDVFDQRKECN